MYKMKKNEKMKKYVIGGILLLVLICLFFNINNKLLFSKQSAGESPLIITDAKGNLVNEVVFSNYLFDEFKKNKISPLISKTSFEEVNKEWILDAITDKLVSEGILTVYSARLAKEIFVDNYRIVIIDDDEHMVRSSRAGPMAPEEELEEEEQDDPT